MANDLLTRIKELETQLGVKHDSPGSPPANQYSHGPGGLLTFPGTDPMVFHTNVGNRGLISQLPATPSVETDPTFTIITGVQDVTGAEKDGTCDNAPVAGLMKGCRLRSVFGRYERATREIDLLRIGKVNDRADPMDLRLVGTPIATSGLFANGPADPTTPGDVLTNEVSRKFWELGIAYHRLLNRQIWLGNPGNNAAISPGGGYKEMTGIQTLVATGHVDIETNTPCPSTDSDIKDFNFGIVDAQGDALVRTLSYLFKTRRDLAERTGLNPVRWALAMRPELFWEITAIYPCAYNTYRCGITTENGQVVVQGTEMIRQRDDMRQNSYLMIDGERVEVILDDAIPEASGGAEGFGAGCFASDIYLLPMSVAGGIASLYLEYMDYGNPSLRAALNRGVGMAEQMGAFLVWFRQTNQCVQWQAAVEPRLILRTPWLAGKITNVAYCPLQHTRTPFPGDAYNVNGGITERAGPSYFEGLWN